MYCICICTYCKYIICTGKVCTHCCVVYCMHVKLPAHMYMHIHSQTTHITLCIYIVCYKSALHIHTHTYVYMYAYVVCQHTLPVISLTSPVFSSLKILGMFLRSKSSLLNGNILHLILSLVGTLDSEHECIEIPYPQAFKDLLAGELKSQYSVKQAGEYSNYQIPPSKNYNLVSPLAYVSYAEPCACPS